MRLPITIPLLSCLTLPLSCQQKPAEDPLAEMFRTFAEAGIELDLEARSLSIEAEVGRPDQLLEYLLINPRGKGHEALLVTEVKPSLLNAALLALGFVKGENARMVDKDLSHRACRHRKDVLAILELIRLAPEELDPRLADQCRRLQRMPVVLVRHRPSGERSQLPVEELEQHLLS